jgi:hypothetical protein
MNVTAGSKGDLLWLTALTAVAAAVRMACLQQPISYDEAYTFLNFVARGGLHLFDYPVPNNHVFHTLLVRASTVVFGHHLWSMRLPAFLAGVGAVPATWLLCRRLAGGASGYLAAAAMAIDPFVVMYSSLARGYSLVVLLTLMLALLGLGAIDRPSFARAAVLSIVGALGLFTIPTTVFALAGVYLWLGGVTIARRRGRQSFVRLLGPCVVMTTALAVLLYIPTIEQAGVKAVIANGFVRPLPWSTFVARMPTHYHDVIRQFSWNVPVVVFEACGVLMVIGCLDAIRRRDWPIVLLVPAMTAGAVLVLVAKESIPFARTWIYMIPFGLIAADVGAAVIMRPMPRFAGPVVVVSCVVAAAWIATEMTRARTIVEAADFQNGASLVQRLKTMMHEGDAVNVMLPIDWPTYYYLWYYRVPSLPTETRGSPSEFFIVDKHSYSLKDMTRQSATLVADYQYAALYERQPDPVR